MKTVNRILKPFLIAAIVLTAFTAQAQADYRWVSTQDNNSIFKAGVNKPEARAFWVLNYWRAKNGLPELKFSKELTDQARQIAFNLSAYDLSWFDEVDRYLNGWTGNDYAETVVFYPDCLGSGFAKIAAFGWLDAMYGNKGHFINGAEIYQNQFKDPAVTHVGLVINRISSNLKQSIEQVAVFGKAQKDTINSIPEIRFPELGIKNPNWASCFPERDNDQYYLKLAGEEKFIAKKPEFKVTAKRLHRSKVKILIQGLPKGKTSVKIGKKKMKVHSVGAGRWKAVTHLPRKWARKNWMIIRVAWISAQPEKWKSFPKGISYQVKIKKMRTV